MPSARIWLNRMPYNNSKNYVFYTTVPNPWNNQLHKKPYVLEMQTSIEWNNVSEPYFWRLQNPPTNKTKNRGEMSDNHVRNLAGFQI